MPAASPRLPEDERLSEVGKLLSASWERPPWVFHRLLNMCHRPLKVCHRLLDLCHRPLMVCHRLLDLRQRPLMGMSSSFGPMSASVTCMSSSLEDTSMNDMAFGDADMVRGDAVEFSKDADALEKGKTVDPKDAPSAFGALTAPSLGILET